MIQFFILLITTIFTILQLKATYMTSIVEEYNLPTNFFSPVSKPHQQQFSSSLQTFEQFAIPDNNIWSICSYCSWSHDGVDLHSLAGVKAASAHESVLLSSSIWQENFHDTNDKIFLANTSSSFSAEYQQEEYYEVSSPVFILPMIQFHPGHLLIDILEGIYHAMITSYHKIRPDALLVLDVANSETREILEDIIALYVNKSDPILRNIPHLLFSFTQKNLPILTMKQWRELNTQLSGVRVVYHHLHVGVDSRQSSYYRGHRFYDQSMLPPSSSTTAASSWYWQQVVQPHRDCASFLRTHVQQQIAIAAYEPFTAYPDAIIATRHDNRKFTNQEDIGNTLTENSLSYVQFDFNQVRFSLQVMLLQQAKLLIATAGTALHNAIFLHSSDSTGGIGGGIVVVYMQTGWCSSHWLFTNQAIILNHTALVICPPTDNHMSSMSGIRRGVEQGRASIKLDDIVVNTTKLDRLLKKAMNKLNQHQHDSFSFNSNTCTDDDSMEARQQQQEKGSWPYLIMSTDDEEEEPAAADNGPPPPPPAAAAAAAASASTDSDSDSNQQQQKNNDSRTSLTTSTTIAVVIHHTIPSPHNNHNSTETLLRLEIFPEFTTTHNNNKLQYLLHTYHNTLRICVQVWPHGSHRGCAVVEHISYYGSLVLMDIAVNERMEAVAVHMWLQLGETGGNIAGSDSWHAIATAVVADSSREENHTRSRQQRSLLLAQSCREKGLHDSLCAQLVLTA